jgi:flagella basal body P-ring formation protein FlgA
VSKEKKLFLVIFLLSFVTFIYAGDLKIRDNIVVKGLNITLGDIFENIPANLKNERITSAANAGSVKKVHVNHINNLLIQNNISPVLLSNNSQFIEVRTYKFDLTREYLENFLESNIGLLNPEITNYNQLSFPTENIQIRANRTNESRVIVEIIIDGRAVRKLVLRYVEKIPAKLLTAKTEIEPGQEISAENFVLKDVLIPPSILAETFDNTSALKFARAAVKMSEGDILLKSRIDYADIVIKGNIVEAVRPGSGFHMTTRMTALQNGKFNEIINLQSQNDRRNYRGRVTDENKVELIY